ncbi:MAG TPA: Flp pilus assembly protein CpaB [Bryobacterales bacterium]|nr:Flp pilus assembly protein CpaB [Bryobacterales bacterium]
MDRKRVTVIFVVAWVSAALLSWFLYKSTRGPQRERLLTVAAASRNLTAGTLLKDSDVKMIHIREQDAPKIVLQRKDQAVNRALLVDAAANEPLLDQKLARRTGTEGIAATIEEGKRAVAVRIDPASGVGELLEPNARVDVLFTRPGKMSEAITTTILQDVRVLSVGHKVRPGEKVDPKAPRLPVVTLLVSPQDAEKLELAKNEGKISLVMRNPADSQNLKQTGPVTADVLDPQALTRAEMERRRARRLSRLGTDEPGLGSGADDSPDLKRKKPEPPPPKSTVDVFRGGKHTQEVFR